MIFWSFGKPARIFSADEEVTMMSEDALTSVEQLM